MSRNQLSTNRVLVVDDEKDVRDLLARWLRKAGYESTTADCAATARTELARQQPELITLDIRMPDCSGLELLEEIKKQYPDVAVVMVTANGDTSMAVRALREGAFGYLMKPVDRDELVAQVHNGLERRRLTLENQKYLCGLEKIKREQTRVIREAHEETIHCLLSASIHRDEETGSHIQRVGLYSELLAAAAGWEPEACDMIRLAAPRHDVGKIGVPDAVLRKPGKLTAEEFAIMQKHSQIGAEMLAHSRSPILRMAHEIVLNHHERWDGTGYPAGLKGEAIPESARIVALVDVFDALTHDRVYRQALGESEVLRTMHAGRGSHFDPRLFDSFMSLYPEMNAIARAIIDDTFNNYENEKRPALVGADKH